MRTQGRVRQFSLALLVLVGVAHPAWAAAWDRTFTAASLASYLEGESGKLIVVAAGPRDSGAREAADALAKAARASGKAKLVMGDDGLGQIAALEDGAIVKKCGNLPVARIIVVRVFPGAGGEAATAVVTMFDKSGNAVGAFSAQAGQPLETQTDKQSAGEALHFAYTQGSERHAVPKLVLHGL